MIGKKRAGYKDQDKGRCRKGDNMAETDVTCGGIPYAIRMR